MATNKTTETEQNVTDFLNSIADETKRSDSFRLIDLLTDLTGFEPKLWGPNIVGFGRYHYTYASGRTGDAPLVGFSPRKTALTLYLAQDFDKREALLAKLGKHKTGQACLYIQKLTDVDTDVVAELIRASVDHLQKQYPDKD